MHTSRCQVEQLLRAHQSIRERDDQQLNLLRRKPFQLKMRVVLALLLALCVANAAHIRSTPTAQTTETVKRSPRFAFHTYETQMMAKGDDGEEGESFVSMLPESMFIEMGGSDGEGGAGAATGSQAAPESESKDATGSSTGATGETGSTGATGQTGATGATAMTGNDEEPSESMDKVLTGQMALGGVLKSNLTNKHKKSSSRRCRNY